MSYNVGRWRTSQDQVLYIGHVEQARPCAGEVDLGLVHRGVKGARVADRAKKLAREQEARQESKRRRSSKHRRKHRESLAS